MQSITKTIVLTLTLATLAFPVAGVAAESRAARVRRAERLAARAAVENARQTIEGRQLAVRDLEEATLLDPERPEYQITLARIYMACGFLGLARHRFERVRNFAPEDAPSRFGLGQVWRYDWLKYLDTGSRDRAIENFGAAARLAPKQCDAWVMLVPLMIERGDLRGAEAAAQHAVEADPQRADALLADAYTAYRSGRLAHADSVFTRVVPRLPRAIRTRFEDIAPIASERDTVEMRRMWTHQRPAFVERFWRELDPDLASPENEARLEYWSRVAHAYLLFYDARRQVWDQRGEVYVRYGAPATQVYNGIGENLRSTSDVILNLPLNVLVWEYPELGMRVTMHDRLLNGFYSPELKTSLARGSELVDPGPDPDSLRRREELFGSRGGRGVFPALPPGARPLPLIAAVSRFEGEQRPRVLAHLEAETGPGDSLFATWVVLDSANVEVARSLRALSPSACAPTEAQVADFANDLPPGRYHVGFSVRGPGNRRGSSRADIVLAPVRPGVGLSDLVVSCGVPQLGGPQTAVRVEPNPSGRVGSGEPLTAYFEIYHLGNTDEGLAHFEFEYTVKSLSRDSRVWIQRLFAPRPAIPPIHTEREEQQIGSLRRQYVSVPVQALPPGPYRLEIRVRDLVAGGVATSVTDFVREGAATQSPAAN